MNKVLTGKLRDPEVIYGKSAYEIALSHGFEGTEEEWLASITREAKDRAVAEAAAEIRQEAESAVSRAETAAENAAEELASIIDEFTYDGREYYAEEGINLFNQNDPLNGIGIWNAEGGDAPNINPLENYRRSHPIKVYCGRRYQYTAHPYIGDNVTWVCKVDYEGNPLMLTSSTNNGDGTCAYIAEFTGFVSFNYYKDDTPMFCEADKYPDEYAPFSRVLKNTRLEKFNEQFDECFHEKSKDIKITPEDTAFVNQVQSENLLDLNGEFLEDCYFSLNLNSFGTIVEKNGVKSCYVPLRGSGAYSIPARKLLYGNDAIQRVVLFDEDKNVLMLLRDGIQGASGEIEEGTFHAVATITDDHIKQGARYLGFTMDKTAQSLMIVKGEEYPSEYIPFVNYLEIPGLKVDPTNPLSGKILSVNGDSICAGAGFTGGYGKIVAENNGMILQNIARGGGTVAAEQYESSGKARHWICQTIANMNADADYAILEGGVNDASIGVPMGEIKTDYKTANWEFDETTFCGAFESMLCQLITRFAGKKVGYIFVHKMTDNFRSDNPDDGTSYYHAAKKCCEKWGVPYLDLNVSVPPFAYFRWNTTDDLKEMVTTYTASGDGWHPNEEGYKRYYVPKIEAWLKSL